MTLSSEAVLSSALDQKAVDFICLPALDGLIVNMADNRSSSWLHRRGGSHVMSSCARQNPILEHNRAFLHTQAGDKLKDQHNEC